MSWIQKFDAVKSKAGAYTKIVEGENLFRLFTFKHKVTPGDFALEREQEGTVKVGDVTEQGFVVMRKHFNPYSFCGKIKSMVSGQRLGECEQCDLVDELLATGTESEKATAKRQMANEQYVFVIVNLKSEPFQFSTIELSRSNALTILEEEAIMQKKGRSIFGFTGRDLSIRYSPKEQDNKKKYKISLVDSTECVALKPSAVNGTIPDLYADPSYVADAWKKHIVPASPDNSTPPTEAPAPASAPKATKAPAKPKAAPKAAGPTWPPVANQKVLVAFGDEKKEGLVQTGPNPTGEDGTVTWEVQVDEDLYNCTLEEMEAIK